MTQQDYHSSITADIPPGEAFEKISSVNGWWATHFEGSSSKVGDIFTVRFSNGDWYQAQVAELLPGKKIIWNVIDAEQTWHEDRKEWTGTTIVWEISPLEKGSVITLTHLGLTPAFECYDKCTGGWNWLMQKSLTSLLAEGKGLPVG